MDDLVGVAGVPLVMGLVEVAKRLGLGSRWAPALAVGLGAALSLGYRAALGLPDGEAWAQAALNGLAAAGLYSGGRTLTAMSPAAQAPAPPKRREAR